MNHQLANLDFRDMVVVSGDRVITTSRKVAAYFDKQHHHIIQKIEKLDCSDEFLTSNFSRVTYEHKGNQYVEYEISKDGAMYIIMSFTGKKAAAIRSFALITACGSSSPASYAAIIFLAYVSPERYS